MVLSAATRIEFRLRQQGIGSPAYDFSDSTALAIPSRSGIGSALVTDSVPRQSFASGRATTDYTGVVRGALNVGDGTGLVRGMAHVFNFWDIPGGWVTDPSAAHSWRGRIDLDGGGWQITLDSVAGVVDILRELRTMKGHAITHVVEARRADGGHFDGAALIEAMEVLGTTLSLARAGWSYPCLLAGYGRSGTLVWEEWGDRRLDPWADRLSWLNRRRPAAGAELASAHGGVWSRWLNPQSREVLRVATALLVEASSGVSVHTRVVIAQTALELLAWQRLVNEGTWTGPQFEASPAHEQVRSLLGACAVDMSIPAALAAEAADPALSAPADGPDFVTRARNRVAHPPKAGANHRVLPGPVAIGAWRLSLRYLQLALLNWIHYTGEAVDPVDLATAPVPWS